MKTKLFVLLSLVPAAIAQAGSATWKLNPPSTNWNSAANWTPATVPNSPSDTASFSLSNTRTVVINSSVELNALVFNSDADPNTITLGDATGLNVVNLVLSGSGITDNSDFLLQTLEVGTTLTTNGAKNTLSFRNNATAGTTGELFFADGGQSSDFAGGIIEFINSATLGSAVVLTNAGLNGGSAGQITFSDTSSAGSGSMITNIGLKEGSTPGFTIFADNSTAGNGVVINNGAFDAIDQGGYTLFLDSSSAADAVIQANRTLFAGVFGGGTVIFADTSTAANATLIGNGSASGGADSGSFQFEADSTGETAEVIGTGNLVIENHNPPGLTIGSLDGSGNVILGSNTLSVGSNNLSTTYAGVIQGAGALTKLGTGLLTLSGANTYSGGTTITAGALRARNTTGSATGTGTVQVNAGTFGGPGVIAGNVTVGRGTGAGASLQPGLGGSGPKQLSIQSLLTFKAGWHLHLQTQYQT